MDRILVIGSSGQIGSELVMELRKNYGNNNVVASDIKPSPQDVMESGPFETLDVLDVHQLHSIVCKYKIDQIYHLAAILSGKAESEPLKAWNINMDSLMVVLELARTLKLKKLFWPSSIAVFGPTTPRHNTPQHTIMEPNTVYGISKLAGERWIEYYYNKYGIDIRSIRYPGLISYKTEAGGGTTDYAVEIFYEAIKQNAYECFLKEDTALPMMFMPDAIKATIDLMETDAANLSLRSSYNVAGISFTPNDVASEIQKHQPDFSISYKPDFRQAIANSWPKSIDDSVARKDWGLTNEFDLEAMSAKMLSEIKAKLG
ncbi:MAG: NAD-dependent epimerase/dehydratase family protein [Bacteroidales bacterium]|nr:NAD-dependent epimerase/dehydratase family protein [Bacteroidales bacterium]